MTAHVCAGFLRWCGHHPRPKITRMGHGYRPWRLTWGRVRHDYTTHAEALSALDGGGTDE